MEQNPYKRLIQQSVSPQRTKGETGRATKQFHWYTRKRRRERKIVNKHEEWLFFFFLFTFAVFTFWIVKKIIYKNAGTKTA